MLKTKLISGMEKCFLDECICKKFALDRDTMLKNERYTFQLAVQDDEPGAVGRIILFVEIDSPLKNYVSISKIESIPVRFPVYRNLPEEYYDNYLRTTPGLYPDLLRPYDEYGMFNILAGDLNSLWIDVEPKGEVPAGEYPITIRLKDGAGNVRSEDTFTLEILAAELP